jgi:hypothetical protein
MRIIGRTTRAFLGTVSMIAMMTACGDVPEGDQLASDLAAAPVKVVAFSAFCPSMQLSKCGVKPSDAEVTQADWDFGVLVFKELLDSPSHISLERGEFDRPSVRKFFEIVGASPLLEFVNRVPWSSLANGADSLVLTNQGASQYLDFNGLRLTAMQKATIKLLPNGTFGVSGIVFSSNNDSNPANRHNIVNIDLRRAGAMQITTDKVKITDFPVAFFSMGGLIHEAAPSPSDFFNALANMILDPNFDWRTNFNVILNNGNMRHILDGSRILDGQDSAFSATIRQIVQNAKYAIIGGTGDMVLAISGSAPLKCVMSFTQVPVLGNVNVGLDFASGFGLSGLKRLPSGNVQLSVYGIKTDIGTVTSGEINGEELRLKVGPLTLPISWKEQASGRGASLTKITCQ